MQQPATHGRRRVGSRGHQVAESFPSSVLDGQLLNQGVVAVSHAGSMRVGGGSGFHHGGLGHIRHVKRYTKANLKTEVENQAPKFDMPPGMDVRFARGPLRGETLGLSLMKLAPGFRIPFGHKHEKQEEVYVVVKGSARVAVEDEVVELSEWDAIRFEKNTMRAVEAGSEGVEYLAFGAGDDPRDAEMVQNWWSA